MLEANTAANANSAIAQATNSSVGPAMHKDRSQSLHGPGGRSHMNKPASINGARFRRVLGNYPTGVCVVTALETDGSPVGLTIGSFTSVSLDPTLVAFFADKRSSTWAQIQNIGRFCVNVLSDDQVEICRNFSQRGGEKFFGLPYRFSPNGSPVLDGVVAWIDCDLQEVYEAGDHDMAIGAVVELDTPEEAEASEPLIFFQGKFCRLQAID